eukprot:TRINITY_DN337_c0_g1_i3.p1 TRINITY_DN337_c0_g1~~TRINITY_DN337_c0_g1_i3.p1  ORF type:complete len:141 (-),score=9.01 TRINITY_DN337_c0_g1_i3:45-467(-)
MCIRDRSFIVAFVCAFSKPQLVLVAAVLTTAMTLALTLYACTTKFDSTDCGPYLFVCGVALLLGSIVLLFFYNKFVHVLLCVLGIILYGAYLIYDTQLIIGDKKYQLDPDDYIIGALFLYLDIVTIFMEILQCLGVLNRS